MLLTFEFCRWRFFFRALEPVLFPPGQAANIVRGAFGKILREVAPPETYAFLFEPREAGVGASRRTDWPRPFVFRCSHLDGSACEPGESFFLDAHIFELRRPLVERFRAVFERFGEEGIGPGRGRADLTGVEQLDLRDQPVGGAGPSSVPLEAGGASVPSVTLRFVTPTELKSGGRVVDRPEFGVLFARLAERIQTLGALYGTGVSQAGRPVPRSTGLPACVSLPSAIRLTRCDLTWEYASRKSTRTGQVHPLGGFSGEADYEGELGEFLPWLRAMRWAGVGRQTVWGKGDVRVMERAAGTPLLTQATPR
ncbi:MAG TPA: CRISPR system precrRNA processing endoribonuclease RAMP protein Cas6 [Bryobacteraceae bacterium]|nr:CRISPR system precrRNA processing endoribonuclease RAMP protein Cas6 [Bryobacteraceae bacterium]